MQEDKEPLFDAVDTVKAALRIFCEMVGGQLNPATSAKEGGITVNAIAMEEAALRGYATATDLADYLVKRGPAPFRDAHETVAHAVKAAQRHARCDLSELPLAALHGNSMPPIEKGRLRRACRVRGSPRRPQRAGRHGPGAGAARRFERHRARLA